jgi:bifunctional NMN adenylyltransferase/nudix hydrolase
MVSEKIVDEIGVVVGRFQIPELHEGHIQVLDEVHSKHNKVIVFLGITPVLGTKRNPLDFDSRKKMLQESYPEAIVLPISDQPCDKEWSKNLDAKIREVCPTGKVVLYGSRDCFMTHYFGVFPTVELEQKVYVSGSQIRNEAALKANGSIDFRRGVIYSAFNRYPTAFGTVDVAVINPKTNEVLMGRKDREANWRFPGGFVNPGESHEEAALRELREETGGNVEVSKDLGYVGSFAVDDWRYRSEADKITTVFYVTTYLFGPIAASDDLAEVAWMKIDKGIPVVSEHSPLLKKLVELNAKTKEVK